MMKTLALALLTAAAIGSSAMAAPPGQQNRAQPPQQNAAQQANQQQNRAQPPQQNAAQQPNQQQNNTQQAAQTPSNQNQMISPDSLSQKQVRQVQRALDKDGFKAGRTDGKWGPETQGALQQFQQNKHLQANGKLNQQTIAQLGLNSQQFGQQGQNPSSKQ